jgi:phage shock protein A
MGILSRFKDIMSANINALLDKAEDPEKMIDQCLRNLNEDLGKVKSETAAVMAEESRSKRELDECDSEIKKYQDYAVKAVNAGNEDDAKKFLGEKQKFTSKRESIAKSYELAHTNATNMRAMHDKLVNDIGELESRKDMVKSKLAVAKTQEKINSMQSSVSSANNSIGAFDKYEKMADNALDKANAMAELNSSSEKENIADLESKYGSSSSASVDDELAALKASLGK